MHVQPDRFELAGDEYARCRFLEGGFGVRVNVVPPIAHLGVERSNFGHDVHRFLAGGLWMRDLSAISASRPLR
jgi:hypothetical protein